jgi:glycine betaine/proline transport system ATP-binding protein
VKLNAAGAPESVLLDGYLGRLLPYQEGMDIAALPATALITAPCDMSMRVAIELRQATGHPVALVEDGKMVGVCGDEEIYAGILRQSSAAERTEEAAK